MTNNTTNEVQPIIARIESGSTIERAKFFCKFSSIEELPQAEEDGWFTEDKLKIEEMVILSEVEFENFKNDLFKSRSWLKGKGGIESNVDPRPGVDCGFMELTESEKDMWRSGSYRKCSAVCSPTSKEYIAVDSQGYDYARYTAIIKR